MRRAIIALSILTITSACCGPRTIAAYSCPPRPHFVGLTTEERDTIKREHMAVYLKFDRNLVRAQNYVLQCELAERQANGGN